jgi:hypothetical protein
MTAAVGRSHLRRLERGGGHFIDSIGVYESWGRHASCRAYVRTLDGLTKFISPPFLVGEPYIGGYLRNHSSLLRIRNYNKIRRKGEISKESGHMEMEQITIQVDAKAARAFKSASEEERRKLEALLSIRLSEVTRTRESLKAIMNEISQKAEEHGLTPEILKALLNED